MRNAILLILVGIIVVSLITIGAAYALPQEVPIELVPSSMPEPPASENTSGYPYLLRTYEGKLAVFTTDLVEPDMVFDVYVRTLPAADQKALEKGVRVETYEELTALIEDYIS
ncbi:BofC C-terminal domain-containing protein [Marasmitruncus massiliensis]|jgi:hypothetical protein|uniref:BofC C-terminal domain-containing protein n=1 Tax=Marasmitruncus massiliensis TaxID=1944642 RepID=UPI000C7BF04A|nr:BofC C-terminal domain-containing protein [Marasmitruncus massiliensis]MBE6907391.1 hypothetical protein [Oscillospiraceae bacterium]